MQYAGLGGLGFRVPEALERRKAGHRCHHEPRRHRVPARMEAWGVRFETLKNHQIWNPETSTITNTAAMALIT